MIEYTRQPIHKRESLLKMLKISDSRLNAILQRKEDYYESKVLQKEDGGSRQTYIVKNSLKRILIIIQREIFRYVRYPEYLHGSLPGRSPETKACAHLGAKTAVIMDIQSYFPSITWQHVFDLFVKGFGFSDSVSGTLADILVYKNEIPQGSPVSPFVANLVLRGEGKLVEEFCRRGFRYTRYVDDIVVSSPEILNGRELYSVKSMLFTFIKGNGFAVKKEKIKILFAPIEQMVMVGLSAGSARPTVPNHYVKNLLVEIKNISKSDVADAKKLNNIRGKIAYVKRFSPSRGKYLLGQFNKQMQIAKGE